MREEVEVRLLLARLFEAFNVKLKVKMLSKLRYYVNSFRSREIPCTFVRLRL